MTARVTVQPLVIGIQCFVNAKDASNRKCYPFLCSCTVCDAQHVVERRERGTLAPVARVPSQDCMIDPHLVL